MGHRNSDLRKIESGILGARYGPYLLDAYLDMHMMSNRVHNR